MLGKVDPTPNCPAFLAQSHHWCWRVLQEGSNAVEANCSKGTFKNTILRKSSEFYSIRLRVLNTVNADRQGGRVDWKWGRRGSEERNKAAVMKWHLLTGLKKLNRCSRASFSFMLTLLSATSLFSKTCCVGDAKPESSWRLAHYHQNIHNLIQWHFHTDYLLLWRHL